MTSRTKKVNELFEKGSPIQYDILQHRFEVTLNPSEILLKYKDLKLKSFTGKRVDEFYNQTASSIQQGITKYLANLPF